MLKKYPVYAQNISKKVMPKICPNNAADMINTIPRYAQGMLEIHQDMKKDMPKIQAINSQDMHDIRPSFKICLIYAQDMP